MPICDFATFCYKGDIHRLHAPGHLQRQVESNGYPFNWIIVVYQNVDPQDYGPFNFLHNMRKVQILDIDASLVELGIDIDKPQYQSPTDSHHNWKQHVINHLVAATESRSDYIVFADLDCWMIKQPNSWVTRGIEIMESSQKVFIVSPNDGESERYTQVMSQQMFLTRTEDFRNADFNQPGWDGDVTKLNEMPEYAAMLEGRMHFYCKATGKYRYVLPSEYRYFHHNRTNEDGSFKMNYSDYGIVI